jgi:FMN phosphatase YigB (HAD superfamily)
LDPGRLTAIVFDVDGTLYRQDALRRAMLLKLLREMFVRPGSAFTTFRVLQAYRHAQELLRGIEVKGSLDAAQLRLASERSGRPEDVVARVVARWMEKEPLGLLERFVFPSVRTLLEAAQRRGLRMGVFSDYPAVAKLEAMGLTGFFDVVLAAQDPSVNQFKPHPSGLIEVLRRLGSPPERSLYIGDRHDVDGEASRAAGVPCIIVGKRGASSASDGWTSASDYRELHAMLFPLTNEPNP